MLCTSIKGIKVYGLRCHINSHPDRYLNHHTPHNRFSQIPKPLSHVDANPLFRPSFSLASLAPPVFYVC